MEFREISKRIVDLKNSKWDKEKSNPEKGVYVFTDKKYVNYRNPKLRPEWAFTWCRYSPHNAYRELSEWKYLYNAVPVTTADPYWPETLVPDGEHKYVIGDLVFVKMPLIEELLRQEASRRAAGITPKYKKGDAAKAKFEALEAQAEREGVMGLSEAEMKAILDQHRP